MAPGLLPCEFAAIVFNVNTSISISETSLINGSIFSPLSERRFRFFLFSAANYASFGPSFGASPPSGRPCLDEIKLNCSIFRFAWTGHLLVSSCGLTRTHRLMALKLYWVIGGKELNDLERR